jgi:hypothetical protein
MVCFYLKIQIRVNCNGGEEEEEGEEVNFKDVELASQLKKIYVSVQI